MRRNSIVVVLFFCAVAAGGAVYGCTMESGVSLGQRIDDFFLKTVGPLWRHGFSAPTPEPDMLMDIKPEPLPKR
jgi:hypothetical protein